MAEAPIIHSPANTGRPISQREERRNVQLLMGPSIEQFDTSHPLSAALIASGIKQYSILGLDSSGKLVEAVLDETDTTNSIKPIGIAPFELPAASTATDYSVWRAGGYNMNALNWPTSYASETQRRNAFEGAQSPTQIVISKHKHEQLT